MRCPSIQLRRPTLESLRFKLLRTFDQPPRHGEDKRHRHVGGIFGQDARRVGNGDAALERGFDVDVVHAIAEIRDQLEIRPGAHQHL